MQISFHGAASDVTGSCHLLHVGKQQILIDCGMFQGSRKLHEENGEPFGFDPAKINLLLLTHAHLDHCGRIPILVKQGFRGRILTTAGTVDLAKLVLQDAAGLQEEEMRRYHFPALFGAADVQTALGQFEGAMAHGAAREVAPGVRATFYKAGHILGSAWILLELEEGSERRRVIFSGDLGNRNKPILNPPDPALPADVVVMESTYGDRNHRSQAESIAEFRAAVQATVSEGGNVVIPTFALERAQDLLYYLRQMVEDHALPADTPVFLDSPMAISATEVFRRHPEYFNPEMKALLAAGTDPFALPRLQFTRTTDASKAIAKARGAVIMAGSGMATGGRILHHLANNLGDARNHIIFVGYASHGTPARQVIDGAREIRIYGEPVAVRAKVTTIGGFSAHADHDDLLAWAQAGGKPGKVLLVHGEPKAAAVLAHDIEARGISTAIPKLGDRFDLSAAGAVAAR
ncbi:MAG: MBL fold metallo-hydrolase [Acidobacteria bacterium]|nr:MAG: MBL fold metallo-hydrolase [Acidobacteriota bacterium]